MTSIFNKSKGVLDEMISLLEQLTGPQAYTAPCAELSNASIGEHTRHVIELYQCLLAGYEKGEVNYDARKRNKLYENDRAEAIAAIHGILNNLEQSDKALTVICGAEEPVSIMSNYNREVLYNLEHCIHHQALIRVALIANDTVTVSDAFGVAPSTIQYRKECAQ